MCEQPACAASPGSAHALAATDQLRAALSICCIIIIITRRPESTATPGEHTEGCMLRSG